MTIKETAGRVLLYLYQLQRTVPASMRYRQLGFIDKPNGGIALTSDKKWLTKDLLDINPSSSDICNAYLFLIDKGFVQSKERAASQARVYLGIHLTSRGIDIIESIEYGSEGKQAFEATFNLPIQDNENVESLIKNTLGHLLDQQ